MLSFSQKLSPFEAAKTNHLHTGWKFLIYLAKNPECIRREVPHRTEAEAAHLCMALPSALVGCCRSITTSCDPIPPAQLSVTLYFDTILDSQTSCNSSIILAYFLPSFKNGCVAPFVFCFTVIFSLPAPHTQPFL